MGCVSQVGEQGLNIARGAVLAAGMPIEVAGNTVNRFCGSGLQAVNYAAMQIMSGQADLAIGGGVESMNRVPMGSDAIGPGEGPASPSLLERFPNLVPQGISAELIAEQWKLVARSARRVRGRLPGEGRQGDRRGPVPERDRAVPAHPRRADAWRSRPTSTAARAPPSRASRG